jgi:hypothetical protein
MDHILLNSLLKSDEYTINQMCKTSKAIRKVCELNNSVLSIKIIKERVSFLESDSTLDLSFDKNSYSSYTEMLHNWKKWGRAREFKIDCLPFSSCLRYYEDEHEWISDVRIANKILDKPENKVLKQKLHRGDIVNLHLSTKEAKFVFDGFNVENLVYGLDKEDDKNGTVPKTYLGIDEFHIRFWENISIMIPIKIQNIKLEQTTAQGSQDARLYSFKKEARVYFLIIISEQGDFPEIRFEDVNYYQLDSTIIPNADIGLEYPEMYMFNIFDNYNTLRYRY